jgi:hypothetical protein
MAFQRVLKCTKNGEEKLCYAELRQKHHPALLKLSIPAETLSTPSDRDMSARPPSDAGCLSFIGAGAGSLSVKRIVRSVAAEGVDGPLLSAGVTLLIFAFRITVPPILYVGRVPAEAGGSGVDCPEDSPRLFLRSRKYRLAIFLRCRGVGRIERRHCLVM